MREEINSHDTEQAGPEILWRGTHAALIGNRYPRRSRLACIRMEAAGDYRHRCNHYQRPCRVDQVQTARVVNTFPRLKSRFGTHLLTCSIRRCGIGKHH
jgi:hypothetical protein